MGALGGRSAPGLDGVSMLDMDRLGGLNQLCNSSKWIAVSSQAWLNWSVILDVGGQVMWPKRKARRQIPVMFPLFSLYSFWFGLVLVARNTVQNLPSAAETILLTWPSSLAPLEHVLLHFPYYTSLLISRSDQNVGWKVAAGEAGMEESHQQVWQKGLGNDRHRNIPPSVGLEEDLEGRKRPFWY